MKNKKIRIKAANKANVAIRLTIISLVVITIYTFVTMDYGNLNMGQALRNSITNIRIVFGSPWLRQNSFAGIIHQALITLALGVLSTMFGVVIAFFVSLLCAENIARPLPAKLIKAAVALIRAVPSVLWVLIFSVSAGLGSVAAVAGLTVHSAGYLIKAYAESIEEVDAGVIEALRASGAGFWHIVFQGIVPSSLSYLTAWTFLRLEINFVNAIVIGAMAGAGGIGFEVFMAGSFFFDLRELGFMTYLIIAFVIVIEYIASKFKARLAK